MEAWGCLRKEENDGHVQGGFKTSFLSHMQKHEHAYINIILVTTSDTQFFIFVRAENVLNMLVWEHNEKLNTDEHTNPLQEKSTLAILLKLLKKCTFIIIHNYKGFFGGGGASLVAQMVKNLPQCRRPGSIPRSGRSPGEESDNPLQCSCLENPMDRGSPQDRKESDMTEQLTHTH